MALQHAELAARHRRRRKHDDAGAVAGLSRVIPDPHRAVTERAREQRFEVVYPVHPAVDLAWLQHRQRKDAGAVVHELAHQQVGELLGAVVPPQLLDIIGFAIAVLRRAI
ncbi:hypothetical protein D3C71_1969350 [compost metagenome]